MNLPSAPDSAEFFDAYLARYMEAWNDADLAAIVAAYHTPCFVFKRGRLHLHLDHASKQAYFAELLEGTRTELAGGSRWSRPCLQIERLGRTSALVTVRWVLERSDGTTVEDYCDSYHLVLIDDQWGFLGDTVHDATPA
jgi:hypothetical protein